MLNSPFWRVSYIEEMLKKSRMLTNLKKKCLKKMLTNLKRRGAYWKKFILNINKYWINKYLNIEEVPTEKNYA